MKRHPTGVIPVLLNDVIFALHAVFACVVTIIQCFIYEVSEKRNNMLFKKTKSKNFKIHCMIFIARNTSFLKTYQRHFTWYLSPPGDLLDTSNYESSALPRLFVYLFLC